MTSTINNSTAHKEHVSTPSIDRPQTSLPQGSQYVQALLLNDNKSIAAIYADFFPMVQRYILKVGGTQEEAKDIFQQAIMILYVKVKNPAFQLTSSFGTYLMGICKYKWLDTYKSKYRKSNSLEGMEAVSASEDVVDSLFHQARTSLFKQKLQALSADSRKVLELYFEGHSMKEIAKRMGYGSEGYARKKKHVCQQQLISLIRQDSMYGELSVA